MVPNLAALPLQEREPLPHQQARPPLSIIEQVAASVNKHASLALGEPHAPFEAIAKPSPNLFARATQAAKSTSTRLVSYSKMGLNALFDAGIAATTKVGASCYHNIPGAKTCAQFLATCTLNKLLPEKGVLKSEITERRAYLATHTKSSICKEACTLISRYMAGYIQHQLVKGEEIEDSLRSSLVKKLLYNSSKERAEYGFFGDVLKIAIKDHPELVSEVIEANLLTVFCNIVKRLKEVQETNSNWLVDLTNSILASYTEDLKKLQANVIYEDLTTHARELFFKQITQGLLKIALPKGANELDLPIPGGREAAHFLMTELRESILPDILKLSWIDATSELTRDKLVLKIFTMAKEFISTGSFASNTEAEPAGNPTPYAEQEVFKTNLTLFTETFIDFACPSLTRLAKTINVEALIKKHGSTLIGALGQMNLIAYLNTALKLTIPLLSDGTWQGNGLEQTFTAAPFKFLTTQEEKLQELASKQRQHENVRQETRRILRTLTADFSGIAAWGVDRFLSRPTVEYIQEVMQSGHFLERLRLEAWLLLVHIAQEILKFVCWFLGKKSLEETSSALYERTKTMYLKQTARPLESIIATIIHTA